VRWEAAFTAAIVAIVSLTILNLVLVSIMLYRATGRMRVDNLTVLKRLLVGENDPALLDQPIIPVAPLESIALGAQEVVPQTLNVSVNTGVIVSSLYADHANLTDVSVSELVYSDPLRLSEAIDYVGTSLSLAAVNATTLNLGVTSDGPSTTDVTVRELHATIRSGTATTVSVLSNGTVRGAINGTSAAASSVRLDSATIQSVGSLRQDSLTATNLTVSEHGNLHINRTTISFPASLELLGISASPAGGGAPGTAQRVQILGSNGTVSIHSVLSDSFSNVMADSAFVDSLYLGRLLAELGDEEAAGPYAILTPGINGTSLQANEIETDSATFASGTAQTLNAKKCKTGV